MPARDSSRSQEERNEFYNSRASEEVCPKHRNNRRETAGWDRRFESITKRCLFFVEMAKGRERDDSPGPFNFAVVI